MKRTWMLLALLTMVLFLCSACQASTEEILAKIEAAATQGDFETVRTINQKTHKVFSLSEQKGLVNYYIAREHEYRNEDAVAWYLYVTDVPGFMDSDERAKTLQEKIGNKGYLFDIGYSYNVSEEYEYFLYGDTLFRIEAPYEKIPYGYGIVTYDMIDEDPFVVDFGPRCALVAPDGTLLTTLEWATLGQRGDYYSGKSADTKKSHLLDGNGQIIATAPWGNIYRCNVEERIFTLEYNGKYGFADFDGNVISEAIWTQVGPFSGGYAAVKDTHWGIIDKSGKLVVDTRFDELSDPESGYAIASIRNDGKSYTNVIDMNGNIVNSYPWSNIDPTFINGAAAVYNEENKQSYLINRRGDILSGGWRSIERSYDGVSVVETAEPLKSTKGLIDDSGRVILEPCMFNIDSFYEGYARFLQDYGSDYGYLDTSGNIAISGRWDHVFSFECGYAEVKKGNCYGLINTKGQLVLNTAYDFIQRAGEDVFLFEKDEKWGAIHLTMNKKIPCVYNNLVYLGEGFFNGKKVDSWGEKTWEIVNIATGQKFSHSSRQNISNAFNGKILIESNDQFILLDGWTGEQEAVSQPVRMN